MVKLSEPRAFLSGLNILGLSLAQEQLDSLLLYCRELRKWSKRVNLIARNTSSIDIVEKHFLDSLTLVPVIRQYGPDKEMDSEMSMLDVGTGAGFPGLVLAVALPELSVILAEPRQKRVSFLRHVIRTLGLKNVQVIEQRIEPRQHWDGPECHFITSRAVAATEHFLPLIEGIATKDTVVIMMGAGDGGPAEQAIIPGWHFLEKQGFALPFSLHPRVLTLLQKQDNRGC